MSISIHGVDTTTKHKKLYVYYSHCAIDIEVIFVTKGLHVLMIGFIQSGHKSATSTVDLRPNPGATQLNTPKQSSTPVPKLIGAAPVRHVRRLAVVTARERASQATSEPCRFPISIASRAAAVPGSTVNVFTRPCTPLHCDVKTINPS